VTENWILKTKKDSEPTIVFSDDSEVVVKRMAYLSKGDGKDNRGPRSSYSPELTESMLSPDPASSSTTTREKSPPVSPPSVFIDGADQSKDGITPEGLEIQDGGGVSKDIPSPEDEVPLPWRARYVPRIMLGYSWLRPSYPDRRVWGNHPDYNRKFKYTNNKVVTSKYNIITFLPLNLLEQFMRVANIYFLVLLLLQLIPEVVPAIPRVSSVGAATTIIPLVIVLGVTAVKDAFDDIKRHISDFQINRRKTRVFRGMGFEEMHWQRVEVGDIVLLKNNDFVTADIVLLGSSEPNSLAYIETAELDGETNLKVRQALEKTHIAMVREGENGAEMIMEEIAKFDGFVVCDQPNNNLHKFEGTLVWDGLGIGQHTREALNLDQLLLRGCRLRNTSWALGIVVYAGHETKLMNNAGKTLYKRTQLDRAMNYMVIAILAFLIFLVICCLVGSLVWELVYGKYFQVYVPYDKELNSPVAVAFYQILSNIIILNTLVPISLYVSVEVIRLCQSFLINWDLAMYYGEEDIPAIARTTTLNEELGQIDYVFSDKTGTLTQNVMVFHKCCIGKRCMRFGDTPDHKKVPSNLVDLSWNKYAETEFEFYDQNLIEKCQKHDEEVARYFKLLALCHTVLSNTSEDGEISYNAQSPDEAALVSAARNFGYVFADRTPYTITLHLVDKEDHTKFNSLEYKLLNILDFNNVRKRMSVSFRCKFHHSLS
jgi:phospholipid-translocating ATPase